MAVSLNTKFYSGSGATSSPFFYVSNAGTVAGTVAANANRVMIGQVGLRIGATPTSVAMTWNSVSMNPITLANANDATDWVFLFGLIAPASGANTISVSWSGGNGVCTLGAACFDSADQTTGWQNGGSDTGTNTGTVSSAVTTANGNAVFVAHTDNNASSLALSLGTAVFTETGFNGNWGAAYKLSTGASETISWLQGSSVAWAHAKVDVIAFAAATGPVGSIVFPKQAVNRASRF